MQRTSLKSIAHELNVSPSLVSKVLSGKMGTTGVNPQVAAEIRDKAQELGYRPNRTAAALITGRHGAIAVFVHHHGQPGSDIVGRLTMGLSKAMARQGQLLWLQYYFHRKDFLAKARSISASNVDGLIVAGIQHTDMTNDLLERRREGLSVVTVHATPLTPSIPNVGCREDSIGEVGTQHLIGRGCTRVAHIGSQEERRQGYRQALAAAGLEWREEMDVEVGDYSYQSGIDGVNALLASGVPFDGIVTQSDHQALAALQSLREHGVDVPGQVRIVGVDDSPLCELTPIQLSSVSQWPGVRGREAVGLLLRQIAGEEVESIEIAPTVKQRESS